MFPERQKSPSITLFFNLYFFEHCLRQAMYNDWNTSEKDTGPFLKVCRLKCLMYHSQLVAVKRVIVTDWFVFPRILCWIPSVTVFGGSVTEEVIKMKWGLRWGPGTVGVVSFQEEEETPGMVLWGKAVWGQSDRRCPSNLQAVGQASGETSSAHTLTSDL